MDAYKQSSLWKTAFPDNTIEFPQQRKRIIEAYERFRERVSLLLQQIQKELPSLTLHDITHVDALWQVASEIADMDADGQLGYQDELVQIADELQRQGSVFASRNNVPSLKKLL